MRMFEYVMVLASIIIGLAMTHILQGVARLVQHPRRAPSSDFRLLGSRSILATRC